VDVPGPRTHILAPGEAFHGSPSRLTGIAGVEYRGMIRVGV